MDELLGNLLKEMNWMGGLIITLTGTSIWGWIKVWTGQFRLLRDASLATLHSQLYEKEK